MTTLEHIRQAMEDARAAKLAGLHESARNIVEYARYWRDKRREERRQQ